MLCLLLSRENTLSEAAEEGFTSSASLAASVQCGRIVSLAFHHSQMFAMFTPLALARKVGSSVFRSAIILESFKRGIALKESISEAIG